MQVKLDRYTRVCLTVLCVLLTVLVVALWAELPMAGSASAETTYDDFGNAGAQRNSMIKAQEATNAKLDELIKVLKSGEVKVQLQGEGKTGGVDVPASKTK